MVIKGEKTVDPSSFAGPVEPRSHFRQALPQILAVCVKNVLLLGFGMTLGFPTILIPSLSGNNPDEAFHLGQEAISWIGSINLICVPVGCILSGAITQPIGRKRAMQLVNIPFLAAWLLFYFSTEVWQVFLALGLTGISGGLLEAPTLTYVAEITQPSLRGILASTSGIAVMGGVLLQFLLGTFLHWRKAALICCIFPITSIIALFFVPESPHWLIYKNKLNKAHKSIAWFRGWTTLPEVKKEFEELCEQMGRSHEALNEKTWAEVLQMYMKKNFFWPFCLTGFAFFLSQFTGASTIQVYAVQIFSTLNVPIDEYYATISLGAAELLGCTLSTCIVHITGKRIVNFISLIGTGACFTVVGVYAYLNNIENLKLVDEVAQVPSQSWVPMVFLILGALSSFVGIKCLPWLLLGEVYHSDIRAMAAGFSGALSYIFHFVASKVFLTFVDIMTFYGILWFYSGLCFFGMIVLFFTLPETEGKTLFEITQHFSSETKLDNKVKRHKRNAASATNEGFESDVIESKL